jgi:argininosuccinate synthase
MKKVVLAYSGGLDTSVAVKWLKEQKDLDVVCFSADLGQGVDEKLLKKRAKLAGASKIYIEDLKDKFARDFVLPSLKANAVYESKYVLATALSRPLIAERLVAVAKKENAKYVAHGCTGKGNDQVRLEVSINALASDLKVIAPVREWDLVSREAEIDYAQKHKIPIDVTKKSPYSLDENLWGVSIECGILEDPWVKPPDDAYILSQKPEKAPAKPAMVSIYFEKGVPKKINGKSLKLVDLIEKLNAIGGKHGIGRTDLVENRLVGIKSREIYEAPGAFILLAAHKEIESLVLDREMAHFKQMVSHKYAELIYYGLWHSPLKDALDAFIEQTQKNVTGTVKMKLYKGKAVCLGRKSPKSLYNKELATYEETSTFNQKLAEGFIDIWSLPYKK